MADRHCDRSVAARPQAATARNELLRRFVLQRGGVASYQTDVVLEVDVERNRRRSRRRTGRGRASSSRRGRRCRQRGGGGNCRRGSRRRHRVDTGDGQIVRAGGRCAPRERNQADCYKRGPPTAPGQTTTTVKRPRPLFQYPPMPIQSRRRLWPGVGSHPTGADRVPPRSYRRCRR